MTTTWLVRGGEGGKYIDDAVNEGVITVDFGEASDVTGLPVEEIATQLANAKSRMAKNRLAEMLYVFANEIEKGDAIITSDRARRQVVVGRVTGPYEWVESDRAHLEHHTLPVTWNARCGWDDLPESVKHAVLHYQRPVLRFEDQDTARKLTEEVEASGASAVYSPPARSRPNASIDLRLEGASRSERLCNSCFIIRPRTEFSEGSEVCKVCE